MVYNFSAGPSMLPLEVSRELSDTLVSSQGSSLVEISHQSKLASDMIRETTELFRLVAEVPDTHEILWSHGGARLHFSAMPMNLIERDTSRQALFVETDFFVECAEKEARRYGDTWVIASSKKDGYRRIPEFDATAIDGSYLHIVTNNTTNGTAYQDIPQSSIPLVGDFTSELLSRKIDFSKFGTVFAGVQKNLGFAGLTVIVIRKDLLGVKKLRHTPLILDYAHLSETNSYANTPNMLAIYTANLILKWMLRRGGLSAVEADNRKKAQLIYDTLDSSSIYLPKADKDFRSIVNVTFDLPSDEMLSLFLKEAEAEGLMYLAGYKSVGGVRASMYNAMPVEGTLALADFMRRFENKILSVRTSR